MSHILFYTDTPSVGGAEKQMLTLMRHLKEHGHRFSLVYGRYSRIASMHADFEALCEKVHTLPTIHKHDPRHRFALRRVIRSQAKSGDAFDAIHLQLWNPGACRYAFSVAAKEGLPIISTEHDPFPLEGFKKWLKKRALRKTTRSIVVSSENAQMMADEYGLPPKAIALVHNGIEMRRFDGEIRADLPVDKGDIILTCVAELHPRKGHQYLLQAFAKLSETVPHLRLVLVGDGPARQELEKRAPKNVHFLGWRKDIPEILRASDIFVLPSLKEAFGMVILEAMASSVPVIATASGGVPDLIEDGKTGYLVPPADPSAIADAIMNILRNPQQKKDVVGAALRVVGERFTAERMARETATVYKTVINP